MHTANSLEPEHAGLWRGVFTHKNIAGPVMACFSFAGLYLCRRGWTAARGASIFCAAMIFMAQHRFQDHGRTGAAHDPDRRAARPDRHAAGDADPVLRWPSSATAIATLGIVFIAAAKHLAPRYFPT